MNYSDAVNYVNSLIPHGKNRLTLKGNLSRVKYFLDKLGNPHHNQKLIHIGGTSGKGSTSTILASILASSGYKVGLHTSPHVKSLRERAQVNQKNISKEEFTNFVIYLKPIIEKMYQDFGDYPSYFEIMFAIALLHFQKEKTDINVIEVGLGGRLDSTNIIPSKYQIITNIGLDHTEILGDTREKILLDKQEIIKLNSTVVSGIQERNLQKIISSKVSSTGSEIYFLNRDFSFEIKNIDNYTTIFNFRSDIGDIKNIQIQMPGTFQVSNASLAIMLAIKLKNDFPKITEDSIKFGIKNFKIHGRFEIISSDPLKIIDGSHNKDKIKALVDSIKIYFPEKKFITILRYKKRNDIFESINNILSISHYLIITGSKKVNFQNEGGYIVEDIEKIKEKYDIKAISDPKDAFKYAKSIQAKDPALGILVTGSFFMIEKIV